MYIRKVSECRCDVDGRCISLSGFSFSGFSLRPQSQASVSQKLSLLPYLTLFHHTMLLRSFGLRHLRPTQRVRIPATIFHRWNSTQSEYLKRYQDRLNAKAQELGYKDVQDLNEKLKEEIESKKKDLNAIDPLKDLEGFEEAQAESMRKNIKDHQIKIRSPVDKDAPILPYKTLSSYIDVDKIKELNKKEIEYIWRARFQSKERTFVAVLDALQFSKMYALAFKNKTFILPLPKESGGYEMHFVQWSFVGPQTTHCMLTTVAEYKLHKEYAKPHTTLSFHQELAQDKDTVLMNGDIEKEANVNFEEAQLLVLNIQRFYGAMDSVSKDKLDLLISFNSGDDSFDMDKLIKEATSFD